MANNNSNGEQMRNGEKPAGCWKCYNDEELGQKSMRQSVNESRLGPHTELIETDDTQLKPLQIKLLSGASCNLACRMCQSHVSSKVYPVWESIGMPLKDPYKYDFASEEIIRRHVSIFSTANIGGDESPSKYLRRE